MILFYLNECFIKVFKFSFSYSIFPRSEFRLKKLLFHYIFDKQRVLKRHSFNPEQIKIKHLFSIKKIKSTSLELKKVTKDEVEDMKKFSIILN